MRIVHFILERGGPDARVMLEQHLANPTGAWCLLDGQEWPCDTLLLMAQRWANDPDYDPAWDYADRL